MSTPASHIRLAAPSDGLHLAIGEQTTLSDGTPVKRFKRYAIKVGETYRKKGWKAPLHVTEDRAARWLSNFQAMKANGVPVKVTKNHEDFRKAESAMGDVVDMGREGNWIYSIHDVRGEKNIQTAEANKDVSVEIYPRLTDGKSRKYEDAIAAITYTTIPVVDSQPIAASLSDVEDTYFLSTSEVFMPELLEQIAGFLGKNASDVTADNALSLLKAHDDAIKLSLQEAQTQLAAKDDQIKKLSIDDTPDPKLLSLQGKLGVTKFDRLVEKGKLQKSIGDEWKSLTLGNLDKNEFAPLLMSLDADVSEKFVDKVCDLLERNSPVDTSGGTGAQLLNRDVPDKDKPGEKKPNPWTNE